MNGWKYELFKRRGDKYFYQYGKRAAGMKKADDYFKHKIKITICED